MTYDDLPVIQRNTDKIQNRLIWLFSILLLAGAIVCLPFRLVMAQSSDTQSEQPKEDEQKNAEEQKTDEEEQLGQEKKLEEEMTVT